MSSFSTPEVFDNPFVTLEGGFGKDGSDGAAENRIIDNRPIVFSADLPDATVTVNGNGEIVNNQ